MKRDIQDALTDALLRILRPLVRIMLRNGATFKAFAELAKQVFVEVAEEDEFRIPGRKQTDSRISVITGLTRKEVKRLREVEPGEEGTQLYEYNRASRVITGWTQDEEFLDRRGNPRDLPLEGEGSFQELVKRYSGDAPVRAVLDELERVGAVQRLGSDNLCLLTRAYIPHTDGFEQFGILGYAVGNLAATIDHNMRQGTRDAYFQRVVGNERPVTEEKIGKFRLLAQRKGQQFLEQLDQWLESESEPTGQEPDRRIGFGLYYFEE